MVTEHEAWVKRRRRRAPALSGPQPAWPDDPDNAEAGDVDFEAVAHVPANGCRRGGRTRRFLPLAQRALTASGEIEALDGIADGDRRDLAPHALVADARAIWPGEEEGADEASAKAGARARTHGTTIDWTVREAAGLDPDPPEEWAEVLRFVTRTTEAAERRDFDVGAGASPFPPLRRTIRPMAPGAAAERWLARFRELCGGDGHDGSGPTDPAGGEHGP